MREEDREEIEFAEWVRRQKERSLDLSLVAKALKRRINKDGIYEVSKQLGVSEDWLKMILSHGLNCEVRVLKDKARIIKKEP